MNDSAERQVSVNPWIIGITGASGSIYARALLRILATNYPAQPIELVVSDGALRVLQEEDGIILGTERVKALCGIDAPQIRLHNNRDTGANIASGSYLTAGMVIVPCSMATVSALSTGYADSLLRRAADVQLKEGRKLILVPRETPLSTLHLENLLRLSRLGVTIAPAMPGFYHRPISVEQFVVSFAERLLDLMELPLATASRWGQSE